MHERIMHDCSRQALEKVNLELYGALMSKMLQFVHFGSSCMLHTEWSSFTNRDMGRFV